jgi:hypothetical protein
MIKLNKTFKLTILQCIVFIFGFTMPRKMSATSILILKMKGRKGEREQGRERVKEKVTI